FVDDPLPDGTRVIGVRVRHEDLIFSVELLYRTKDGQTKSLGRHGRDGGKEETFLLQDGEFIQGISGKAGPFLHSLVITTNKPQSKPFGGPGAESASSIAAPSEGVGFFGRSGAAVDRIGMLVRPKN